MEIIKASSCLRANIEQEISQVFVDGYYEWLHYFSKDKNKLCKAFAHMFNKEVFYILIKDDMVAGIAALTDKVNKAVKIDKKQLKKHLGFIKGSIAGNLLKKYLENKIYHFPLTEEIGIVEFVATAINFRQQGVAKALISNLLCQTQYKELILEVANTNLVAFNLYEKLGFKTFMKIKDKNSEKSKIDYLIYMKLIY